MRSRRTVLGLGLAATLAVAGGGLSSSAIAQSAPIKIGYVAPLSGPAENFGKPNYLAFKDYIDDINAAGGVGGRKIEVVLEDDKCTPDQAVRSVRKLIADSSILAILGLPCSAVAAAMPNIVRGAELAVLSASASGAPAKGAVENMFYVSPSTYNQGRGLIKWAASARGAKRIALLRATDAYGSLSYDGILSYISQMGLELVADEAANRDASDITAQFASIRKANPDVVLLAVYPTTAALYLRQTLRTDFKAPTLAMAAAEPVVDLVEPAALANFHTLTAYAAPVGDPKIQSYVDEYLRRHPEYARGSLPALTFIGRSEGELLIEAISRVKGELTRSSLRDGFKSIQGFTPKAPSAACAFDFTKQGNEGVSCATLMRFEGNKRIAIQAVDGY